MSQNNVTTIARALVSLKHRNEKFTDHVDGQVTATVAKKGIIVRNGMPVKEYRDLLENYKTSIMDQLDQEFIVRKAIAESNAKTIIKFGTRVMTIADALLFKQHIIPKYKAIINEAQKWERSAQNTYNEEYRNYERQIVSYTENLKDTDNTEILNSLEKQFKPEMISSAEWIKELEETVSSFEMELDAVLSESNAITQITV